LTTHQDISHLATKSEIPSLDGYATEKWIADQGYASDFDLKSLEYNSINNIPLIDDGTGDFIIIDENSHIGAKLSNIGFYAKNFIISTGSLSDALNRISQLETQVADLLARIQVLEGN
jgi:hypothetical protein